MCEFCKWGKLVWGIKMKNKVIIIGVAVLVLLIAGGVILFNQKSFKSDLIEPEKLQDISLYSGNDSGGTITTDGEYTIHTFTSGGTYTANSDHDVEILIVGAGGGGGCGGGCRRAGGGGGC